ncbi:MAG: site-2 protease family protein, partial [Clostridia bacterium]|nr:site-2 protease family protein [Clostridia bacterium]
MYIVLAILIFGLLIIVHEFGHFLVAKAVGVRVNQFSVGLGPRLFGKKIGETDFCVCALPIGGACVMEGEEEESDDSRAFLKKPIWARFLILVAGSVMNFLMGVVILVIIAMPMSITDNRINSFPEVLGETNGGLLVGDEILKVDGERVIDPSRIAYLLSRSDSDIHEIVVRRNGEKITLENVELIPRDFGDGVGLRYGINLDTKEDKFINHLAYSVRLAIEDVRIIRLSLVDLISGGAKISEMSGPVGI